MSTSSKQTYHALSTKLEEVMDKLQAEDLDVDSAVKLYEQGLELVQQLEVTLGEAENKIRELKNSQT